MRIGLANYEFKNGDKAFNFSQIEKGLSEAQGKADLLCFGEAFLQGFDCLCWDYDTDKNMAVSRDSQTMRTICAMSRKYGVDLAFGYIEREDETLYSSCAVIIRGELAHNYRRISKGWKEFDRTDEHYSEGEATVGFDYRGQYFKLTLCGDLWDFPEKFKTDGILLWPVFVSYSLEDWQGGMDKEYADQARLAAERTLMVGSICRDPNCPSLGGTFFFDKGEIIARAEYGKESILIVEL